MDMWTDIRRRVLVKGESKRSIIKRYGIHWTTLDKILSHSEPPGYRQSVPRKKPVLDAFLPIIHQILNDDKQVRRKQRHSAKRIFDRLREEYGYQGGYTMVKDAVRAWKMKTREAFVPLSHPPGEAQVDFGHAEVVVDGKTWLGALFVMTLPYSDAFFVALYPRECTESFIDGHLKAFAFLGGVPTRISYDNTRIAVATIVGGRGRSITAEFQRLVSHHLFEHHFCLVRRPNEKGHVERLVRFTRSNYLVPIPRERSFAAINQHLKRRCKENLAGKVRGKEGHKAERLEDDRQAFIPIPDESYQARRIVGTQANSLALVRFDGNDYSVPTACAHHPITACGGIEHVELICNGERVARHKRIWEKEQVSFDPLHYLALLERKPGAFDYARPLEQWQLPECLRHLRRKLEGEQGHQGTRSFIKVLRLLENFKLSELAKAVGKALEYGTCDADAIRLILEGLRERPTTLFSLDGRPHLSSVHVAPPELSVYGVLTASSQEVSV